MEISTKELSELLEEARHQGSLNNQSAKGFAKQICCPQCSELSDGEFCWSCACALSLNGLYHLYQENKERLKELQAQLDYVKFNNVMIERQEKEIARSNQTSSTWMRVKECIDKEVFVQSQARGELENSLEKEFKPKDVYLVFYPQDKRIATIKLIREILGLGLKDAKDLSESVPALLLQNVDSAHFDALKIMFEEIGAKIEANIMELSADDSYLQNEYKE